MIILNTLNQNELENVCVSLGEKPYRAKQIQDWIYLKNARNLDDMKNISNAFKEKLSKIAILTETKIANKQISKDGTIKYLLQFGDNNCVETVLMRFDNRANLTACVSSQIGCKMGCNFCATAKCGFKRNLKAFEIVEQVLAIQADTGLKVTNIVFMGQGEPLDNYNEVYKAVEILNERLQIGIRRMTLSSCGIVDEINRLNSRKLLPTLAISLHAPNDEIRNSIMPINTKYNMQKLKNSLIKFVEETKNRVTIEYVLLDGVNNLPEHAKELANYLKEIKCNVNLIPYNGIDDGMYKKPNQNSTMLFKLLLEQSGKKVTQRLERGSDIDASCGQLANKLRGRSS